MTDKPSFNFLHLLLLICLFLGACGSIPKIPVSAAFYGELINTTVDSEIARYYLENYLLGENNDLGKDREISELYSQTEGAYPTSKALKNISREYSVDFAALFLADRLLSDECNRGINRTFAHFLDNPAAVVKDPSPYRVLFVPGWDYAETGFVTGSDFRRPRRLATEFGLENLLVPLPPTGGVEENAEVLNALLSKQVDTGKKIILVGASSAGPAIHLVLARRYAQKAPTPVVAWLNIGGILQGSPVIDHYQKWYRRWFFDLAVWHKGWDKEAILSMTTKQSRQRFAGLRVDPNLLTLNYLGIPLSGQISRFSEDNYPLLRAEGPNDGFTLLADAIAPNSMTIVAFGSDHFLAEDPRIDEKTVALMKLLISRLEGDRSDRCGRQAQGISNL